MDIHQYALTAARRTNEALDAGRIEEALRLSGEATATLDAEWTRLRNECSRESDKALTAANFVAVRHLDALMQADATDEALSTALMLLYRSTLAIDKTTALAQSQLDILCGLLSACLAEGVRRGFMSADADAGDTDHFAHIVSYIASMLYAFYRKVGEARPDTPVLETAYSLLEQMDSIGAISYPSVKIKDDDIPADDISAILPDLLGRARALSLFKTD